MFARLYLSFLFSDAVFCCLFSPLMVLNVNLIPSCYSGNDSMSPEQALSDSQSELSMSGSLSQTSNL